MDDTNEWKLLEYSAACGVISQLGLWNLNDRPADALRRLNAIAMQALSRAYQAEDDFQSVAAQRDSLLSEVEKLDRVRKHAESEWRTAAGQRASAVEEIRRLRAEIVSLTAEVERLRGGK